MELLHFGCYSLFGYSFLLHLSSKWMVAAVHYYSSLDPAWSVSWSKPPKLSSLTTPMKYSTCYASCWSDYEHSTIAAIATSIASAMNRFVADYSLKAAPSSLSSLSCYLDSEKTPSWADFFVLKFSTRFNASYLIFALSWSLRIGSSVDDRIHLPQIT